MVIKTNILGRINRIVCRKRCFLYFLVMALFSLSCENIANLGGDPITEAEVNETRRMCKEMNLPESFKLRRAREFTKYSTTVFSSEYEADAQSLETVNQHFITQLISQGWENHSYQTGGTIYLDFRKQKYSVVVEYDKFSLTATKVFNISCSWGIDK